MSFFAANFRSHERWTRRALILWGVLAAAVTVKTFVQQEKHSVYPVFSTGAVHWWRDASLYEKYPKLDLFRYSPAYAIAHSPLAHLPVPLGSVLWNLISIGLCVAAIRTLARDVLPGHWPAWREGLLLGLSLLGSARSIWSGQSNTFLISLVIFGLACVVRERWWWAAWLLTAATFVKPWPFALLMLLAVCRPKRLAGRMAVACAGWSAIPFLTRPPSVVIWQYQAWWNQLVATRQSRWPGFRDAWTIWENFAPPVNGTVYTLIQLTTAAAVLGWCLWLVRRTKCPRQLVSGIFAMWLCWQMLFGPGTEILTYTVLAPVATWSLLESYQQKRLQIPATLGWSITGLFSMGAFERILLPIFSAAPVILPLGVLPLAAWLILSRGGEQPPTLPPRSTFKPHAKKITARRAEA